MYRQLALGIAAVALLGLLWTSCNYRFLMFARPTSDPNILVYRLDSVHRLAFAGNTPLLINKEDHSVVRLDAAGVRWGDLGMWPRDDMQGVVLGDGVQGNEEDRYDFDATGVEILYNGARQTYRFRVEL